MSVLGRERDSGTNWYGWLLCGMLVAGLAIRLLLVPDGVFAGDFRTFEVGLPLLPTRWTILDRLSVALDSYTSVSMNAYNLWQLIAPGRGLRGLSDGEIFLAGLSYQTWGMFLLATALIPSLRWLGVVLSATYLLNVYEVFSSAGRAGIGALDRFGQSGEFGPAGRFGPAGSFSPGGFDQSAIIGRDASAVNLLAFLAVLLIGLYLALKARSEANHSKRATIDELELGSTTKGDSWYGSESYKHRSA